MFHAPSDPFETPLHNNAEKTDEERFNEQFIRAAHEDDDGYDPYSDRVEFEPLFERDPWI